jgi:hypothetical protein
MRLNISYRVSTYKSKKEEERVLEIKSYIDSFIINEFINIKNKVLIFCPLKTNIELVASILNCNYYILELS